MDEEYKGLHDYINEGKHFEAKCFVQDVSNTLKKELLDAVIDVYILNIFDERYGFLSFVEKTVDRKIYSEAVTECIEVIYSLLNNVTLKIEKYTPQIRQVCLKVILTANSSAKEKKRALNLLQLIFERTNYYPQEYLSKENVFIKLYRFYESLTTGEALGLTIETLGILIKKDPCVTDRPEEIYQSILRKLQTNVSKKNESPVSECFSFLSDILEVYPDVDVTAIYNCIKQRMHVDSYRKTSHREGLKLLTKHVQLFSSRIYKDAYFWRKILNEWLEFRGDNLKAAFLTLDTLHVSLSKSIAVDNEENKNLCLEFWNTFCEGLFHTNLYGYKLRLSIRGFGYFSGTIKIFLPKAEVSRAFWDFIHKIEKNYLIDLDRKPDDLDYLPDYVQSLSEILQQLDGGIVYELGILQQATILVIKLFPKLSNHHYNMVVNPIILAYNHVRTYNRTLSKQYLLNTIKEGIIHSCSHAIVNADMEYEQDITTYRNYLLLWENLLNKKKSSFSTLNIDEESATEIQREIFDEFMATLFYIMDKLNLNTRLTDDSLQFTDPKIALQPVKISDFNIFVNAVDLYTGILRTVNKNLFKKWLQLFLNRTMLKSNRHPLVSGFYKLLAVGLKISNDLNYFNKDRLARDDVRLCYETLSHLINRIILKIKLYKDDLKISCIQVILSAPPSIVSNILPDIAPAMISLFGIGRSNLSLAEMGMDTLEFWYKEMEREDFEPFLKSVLPCLDTYLSSKSISEKFDSKTVKTRRTRLSMQKQKIVTVKEGDLFKIQKRILSFLGGLSNEMCRSFVESNETIGDTLYYRKRLHLKVELTFADIKIALYLEKFIARIIEMSLYCSERKLRINACEVLHAIVLVVLGKTKGMDDESKKDLHGMLKKTFDALLLLSCDPDITVQKILRPLMLQSMHWYSSKSLKGDYHTAIVIETLLDGVTQTNDSAVRDFSCICIREFVEWSIKQSTKTSLSRDPINIQIILRKLKFFSAHSDPSKRFAAALIFNNLYAILREESYLFEVYWIELLSYFVLNLSMIDEYDEYDCLTQVNACLDHLQRGFVEKCDTFNDTHKDRKTPPNFEGCLLIDVAWWLLKQTNSTNRHCREKCFSLFANIAPLCLMGDLKEFMKHYESSHGVDYMKDLYFQNRLLKTDSLTIESLFKWMLDLQCLLDVNIFFHHHKIVPEDANLPIFHEAIDDFYMTIHPYDLQHLSKKNGGFTFSNMNKTQYNNLKNAILAKCTEYFIISGEKMKYEQWYSFTTYIFENIELLSEDVHAQQVNLLLGKMKDDHFDTFLSSVYEHLTKNLSIDCDISTVVPFKQRQLLKGLLILKKSILCDKINLEKYMENALHNLFSKIIQPDGTVLNLQHSTQEYCQLKVQLCLTLDKLPVLIEWLCNNTIITAPLRRDQTEFGKYLFDTFKTPMIGYLTSNYIQFFDMMISKPNVNLLYFVEEIVQFLLTNRKQYSEDVLESIAKKTLSNWVVFEEFYSENIDEKIKGLKLLEEIFYLSSNVMDYEAVYEAYRWIVECLNLEKFILLPHKKFEYLNSCIAALGIFLRDDVVGDKIEILNKLRKIEDSCFTDIPSDLQVAATLSIYKSFLGALQSKSRHLFAFASKIFVLVQPKEDINIENFCKIYMRDTNDELQSKLLDLMYAMITDYTKYLLEVHYKLTKEVLLNLLRFANYEVFEAFFVKNIEQSMFIIKKKATNRVEYAEKCIAFMLTGILFSRLDKVKLDNVTCPITKSAFPNTKNGKELIKTTIAELSQLLKDNTEYQDEDFQYWNRLCKCECYNALISVVCNIQKDAFFYDLLFKRDLKGENLLWKNIVDNAKDYTFPIDFDQVPQRRKNLVTIRSAYRAKRYASDESLRYIESQNILNSTLNDDVTRYDLSKTILRSQLFEEGRATQDFVEMQVDVDGDELNSHVCMTMLCGLFQHVHDEKVYETANGKVPKYIESLKKDLSSDSTSRNVKLFLIKAIENKRELFKEYAGVLFSPIMKAIVDGVAGNNINYFVTDLIVMLVFWADGLESIEYDESATDLVNFLVENVNNERADIMKYHIDLIKFFVEHWKHNISAPRDYLLRKIESLGQSKKVLPIIHISSIFLANGLPPWKDVKVFVKKLIEILSANTANVYTSCAEAIGTALRYVKERENANVLVDFEAYLVKKLKKFDENKYLTCLQAIMKHYPEICDGFLNLLTSSYDRYPSKYKTICLKIFLERIDILQERSDFRMFELEKLISDDDDQIKVIGLEIIRKTVPRIYFEEFSRSGNAKLSMKREKFLSLLSKLTKFIDSENNVCRSGTYDIFMDVYEDEFFSKYQDITTMCKDVLLQGLVDRNVEIEEKLFNFWKKVLPVRTDEKFLYLLKNMYKANIEDHYLGYYINFILDELISRKEYQEDIFEYALADCTYTEYQIKDNWRERHSTLAPMFAESYRSQMPDDFTASASTSDPNMMLRATNFDMEFEPTARQSLLESEKFDVINKVVETHEESDADEAVFKVPWPVKLKKRRFDRDPTKSQRGFALREMDRSSKVEKKRKDISKQRQQEVNIYRSYRKGDFPDIKITISDIVTPLKTLVKHDGQIARVFYTTLFDSITSNMEDNEIFFKELNQAMNNIFENSLIYDANVIGALIDIALAYRKSIAFSPEIVVRTCLNSGLLSSGSLLLEEYLIHNFDVDEHPIVKQNAGYSKNPEIDCWIKLADLYKEQDEWDLVRAVFLYKINCDETVISAIDAESQGYWKDAQKFYEKAIEKDHSFENRDFYYESFYRCFAELSEWEYLSKSVKLTVGENDYWKELWNQDWHQQKLLPWFITAELRNSLVSVETRDEFVSLLNDALSDNYKLTYIKQNFSEELGFLYLLSRNFDKVMYFMLNNIELFLSNWSSLSPLLTSLKVKKLTKMQNSLQIYNFVTKFNSMTESNNTNIINDLCRDWLSDYKEKLSSIVPFETKTTYRTQCLSILQSKFDSEQVQARLRKVEFQLEINLVNTAVDMKNFHMARKYIRRNKSFEDNSTKEGIKYALAFYRILHLKAMMSPPDMEQVSSLINIWDELNKCLESDIVKNNVNLHLSTEMFIYDLIQGITQTLSSNDLNVDHEIQKKIKKITQSNFNDANSIGIYGFDMLRNVLDSIEEQSDANLKSVGDAHLKLATFIKPNVAYKKDLIIHILRAMFYGSSEARQIFPLLLDIEDLGSAHKDTFLTEAEKLPEWMFIQWIPQLLANLDTPNIFAIFPILEKIAKTYPQAIMYAYRLSKEKYLFEDESIKNYGEQAIRRLDELLNDALVDKFLTALRSVSSVITVLTFYKDQLIKACRISEDNFKQKITELRNLYEEHIDYNYGGSLKGRVFKEIVSLVKNEFLCLGNESFDAGIIEEKLRDVKNKLKCKGNRDREQKLSYYSPWLENFSDIEMNINLEIPGQYTGNKKPLLQHHAKICGFSSEVHKFESLRGPLKITIIGSDAKEYPFIVKFGEDLRQDQRVEQIFQLMNNIFNSDPMCREKRLSICTYQVVPLTDTLGIIECVPKTVTYDEFLTATIPEYSSKTKEALDVFMKRYLKRITSDPVKYNDAVLDIPSDKATAIIQHLVNLFPPDMFKKAIEKLSVDSESFVALRNKFIASHTVTCVANWILGIGDRHLSNSLISLENGRTLDVDFGYAFGASVQFLPVPELVPFRLTPHIVNLMQPLKVHGLIEETMIHALRALRNNSESLLSTLNIFVKEPLLQWMQYKLYENDVKNYRWRPEKKVEYVKRKLDGATSVEIMIEELQDRISDSKVLNKYIEYVKVNDKRVEISGSLSVEEQVKCLLNHATDYNLLCRLFCGYNAWI